MRDINLLPPKQRQKRLALSLISYITFGFLMLIVTLGGFAVTLTTIQVAITDKINSYVTQRTSIEKQIVTFKPLEDNVISTNKLLKSASGILDLQMHPDPIIQTITNRIGPSLTFTSVAISQHVATTPLTTTPVPKTTTPKNLYDVVISGTAKQRADIIDFKRAMEALPQFTNITYTISTAATTSTSSQSTPDLSFSVLLTASSPVTQS